MLCKHYAPVHSKTSIYTVYTKSGSNWYCSAYKDHIFYNKRYATNVYATIFFWILTDAIPKFQKITRQMLCDKCSKNDVTLIPPANVKWREKYAGSSKFWRHFRCQMGAFKLLVKFVRNVGQKHTSKMVALIMGMVYSFHWE
jgi:hypothetical protein